MNSTKEVAQRRFAEVINGLQRLGAPKSEYSESPYFGDYVVTGTWPQIQFRLVSDRGIERCELRPSHSLVEDWFDIPLVLGLLAPTEERETLKLEDQTALLGKHLDELLRAFQSEEWPTTRVKLRTLRQKRAKKQFGWSPES